jgi:hypothetical protein
MAAEVGDDLSTNRTHAWTYQSGYPVLTATVDDLGKVWLSQVGGQGRTGTGGRWAAGRGCMAGTGARHILGWHGLSRWMHRLIISSAVPRGLSR